MGRWQLSRMMLSRPHLSSRSGIVPPAPVPYAPFVTTAGLSLGTEWPSDESLPPWEEWQFRCWRERTAIARGSHTGGHPSGRRLESGHQAVRTNNVPRDLIGAGRKPRFQVHGVPLLHECLAFTASPGDATGCVAWASQTRALVEAWRSSSSPSRSIHDG